MIKVVAGVFLIMHSIVHLLYFGHSARLFELKPGMTWPDGSWLFSKLLGDNATRTLASIFCILAAIGFVIGAVGIFAGQPWWRTVVIAAAAFSGIFYIFLWNGRLQNLDGQGGIGLLIDAAILVAVLVLRWPKFDF